MKPNLTKEYAEKNSGFNTAMKIILLYLLFIFLAAKSFCQTANAGSDVTIYLTQTSTATIGGASSGTSYAWTKIYDVQPIQAGHPTDPATITSPTSATTTVTGLIQGTWYYQIAVTTGATTRKDTVVVRVDYDVPPAGGTLIRNFEMGNNTVINFINNRSDTTQLTSGPSGVVTSQGTYIFDRCRSLSMMIDSSRGKFYTTVEDGYHWQSSTDYARSEVSFTSNWVLDTTKTYCFEWKGYFANDFSNMINTGGNDAVSPMQIHGNNALPPPFISGFFVSASPSYNLGLSFNPFIQQHTVIDNSLSNYVLKTHTIRYIIREGAGYPGQDGFIKIEIDGVQKYLLNTGQIGATLMHDYPKFMSLYDYDNALVSVTNKVRVRKFSLVTESFKIYTLGIAVNQPPVANAGTNKNITLPTSSITQVGSGSDADGTIVGYLWTKSSGPSGGTITSPTSATTTITGLQQGTYVFQLRVTDDDGSTATDTMSVVVNPSAPPNQPPTANAGGNKTITLPTSTVTQAGSGTDTDGTIVSYAWTQSGSNPKTSTIVSPTSATTVINGMTLAGTYSFTLTVTDNDGATGFATMQVTVNSTSNVLPVANAGSDKVIAYPTNSTTLSGSGTDSDGTIVSYAWDKVSGPAPYGITNAGSATATVTGLTQGVYQFRLTVTDNSGGVGTDVAQVTMNNGSATVSFVSGSLTTVYTGASQSPTLQTTPSGLSTSITLNGVTGGKINVGSYAANGVITNPNWTATPATGTFTITKATAVFTATTPQTFNEDGLTHIPVYSINPNVTGVSHNWSSGSAPTTAGTYTDTLRLNNANYQATDKVVTVTIVTSAADIFISDTSKIFNTFPQAVTVTSAYTHETRYNGSLTVPTAAGTYLVISTITQVGHTGADTATLTIARKPASLSWVQPGPAPDGTKLGPQLNPASDIPGSFAFTPPNGTVLKVPAGITLTVIPLFAVFTPSDQSNYSGGTISTSITVYANPFLNFILSDTYYKNNE